MFMCLFATGGIDLCGPMRDGASDNELYKIILDAWQAREDRYSELRSANTDTEGQARVEMFRIGG
jgi:cyclic pyranopterin phosphate synthase